MTNAITCDANEIEKPERCLLGKINIAGAYQILTGEQLYDNEISANSESDISEAAVIPDIEEPFSKYY